MSIAVIIMQCVHIDIIIMIKFQYNYFIITLFVRYQKDINWTFSDIGKLTGISQLNYQYEEMI